MRRTRPQEPEPTARPAARCARRALLALGAVSLLAGLVLAGWIAYELRWRDDPLLVAAPASSAATAPFSWEPLARVLAVCVRADGSVDYEAIVAAPGNLEGQLAQLAALPDHALDSMTRAERIAFWCNAYDTLVLAAVVQEWPLAGRWPQALVLPRESILQIPNVWRRVTATVAGRDVTLDEIEHEILRPLGDPRVHMAIVCASRGCPPLRSEPYVAAQLDAQLDDQACRFFADPAKLRVDRTRRILTLSPILSWFRSDFPAPAVLNPHVPVDLRGAVEFAAQHAAPADATFLREEAYAIDWAPYDWSLNR